MVLGLVSALWSSFHFSGMDPGLGTIPPAGPKLSIAFDKRGEKQIIDSYVKRLKK